MVPASADAESDPFALIASAVERLRAGGLVGMPTETVYGLAGDAANPQAVARIFALKGRPADHPVIVHLAAAAALDDWAAEVPDTAYALAAAFWPGPLTLILRRGPRVPDAVTGGQDTVGLRVPVHPLARALLRDFGGGLAAPSANRFGRISPTSAAHVRAEFGDELPLVLDGGPCAVGIESTIVDLSGVQPRLLRPGGVAATAVEAVLGRPMGSAAGAPRAPGMLPRHYAPRTRLRLLTATDLLQGLAADGGAGIAVLACTAQAPAGFRGIWRRLPASSGAYARGLYAELRLLDELGAREIRVEQPPAGDDWAPVADRLRRAAA